MSDKVRSERKAKHALMLIDNQIKYDDGSISSMLTVFEAAQALNLSVATVRRWCADGRLPCHRFSKLWMISARELERWLIKNRWSSE